jgi:phage virion morphogenesis protein
MTELTRIRVLEDTATPGLARLRERTGDLTPLMRQIAGIMDDAVEENFAREGRPRWKDLAPATKKARARKGYWPGAILQQRGELAASITRHITSRSAAVGTNKRYAAIQHFGGVIRQYARSQKVYFRANERTGEIGRRFVSRRRSNFSQWATRGDSTIRIPARPFLLLAADGEQKIEAAVAVYLAGR